MRIVITGLGPITAAGIAKDDFWRGLCTSKTNLVKITQPFGDTSVSFFKHVVENFNIEDFDISKEYLSDLKEWKGGKVETDMYYLLAAAKLALEDSGLKYDIEKNNIGLVVTHENPGLEDYFSELLLHSSNYYKNNNPLGDYTSYMYEKLAKSSFELQTFMPLYHVAKILGLHGYSLFINNACASGAYAMEEAAQIIESGKSSVVVLVAADNPQVFKYLWFKRLNLYSENGMMMPFSDNTDGFIFGDGAAGLVLESLDHALARGAEIYGEYLGGGFYSEGWKISFPSITEDSYGEAINSAFKKTQINKKEIDVIVPHGISTQVTDRYEMRSISRQFKGMLEQVSLCSLKPLIGHTLGANTALEILIILLMIKKECLLREQRMKVNGNRVDLSIPIPFVHKKIAFVLKTTAAFAGYRSAILLKRFNFND
ncbi:MAG: hypothetical protein H6754_01975 [Candidatus Omnitrophica bacterium]|nr:hypothetical protein [Candidatus Omnitrophota bacterium]